MTNVHMSNGASNSWVGDKFTSHLVEQIAVMVQKENASYLCVDYLGELPKSNGYLIDEGLHWSLVQTRGSVIDFYVSDVTEFCSAYVDLCNIVHSNF